jgi:UDP-N-acetylmuramoyl-L-alanyl-D-glutamate--2,6-diaminopimelate ligase
MRILAGILNGLSFELVQGNIAIEVNNVLTDNRNVEEKDVFVAIKGTNHDGHAYINQAILRGAKVIVGQYFEDYQRGITYIKVSDSRYAFGIMSCNYFDNPSAKITLIGVTGTNGKTSIATMLYRLFTMNGSKCGLLSTIKNLIQEKTFVATHTTGDAWQINKLLSLMVDRGCTHAFMECSSHAIDQDRIAGLHFDGVIFSNITHDHLDYHGTFDAYIKAKKKLFDNISEDAFALVNVDDKRGNVMLQNCRGKAIRYAMHTMADVHVKILENSFDGLVLLINKHEVYTRILGKFNAYNIAAVYAVAVELGISEVEALRLLSNLPATDGRFEVEYSTSEKIVAIVDYAHTPDALKNVLDTINDINKGKQKVITVLGCGGNRDAAKRPLMGMIAAAQSNKCIITSDNPRSENPQDIIDAMREGVQPQHRAKLLCIADRKEAIRTAVTIADEKDIILIAGKGHEDYQEINGIKYPFDDRKIIVETFKEMHR